MLRYFKIFVKCELPILVCFISVSFLIYHNALYAPFIWDDEGQIVNNLFLRTWEYWPRFFSSGTFYNGGSLSGLFFRPFMLLYFSILYFIDGLQPFVYHTSQLIFHILNSWIVYLYIKRLLNKSGKSRLIAVIIGLLFLVHPVQVEAVTYISNSQEMLFFFFGITSLYILILPIKTYIKFPLIAALLLCSLLSKESGILFIILHVLYTLIYSRSYIKHIVYTLATTLIIYMLLRCNIAHLCVAPTGISPIISASFTERLITMPLLFQTYVGLIMFPHTLISSRHWIVTAIDMRHFYLPLAVSVLSLAGFIYTHHKLSTAYKQHYIFFFVWFLAGVILHLHIVPLDFTLAERWLYMPLVGILAMISLFLVNSMNTRYLVALLSILLICASVRSYIRVQDWKSPYVLFKKDSLHSPEAYDLKINLGVELFRKQQYTAATEQFYLSTRIAPRAVQGWLNLGIMYERMNKPASAAAAYKEGMLKSSYPYAFIYDNYATLLIKQKKYNEAETLLTKSIHLFPDYSRFVTLYNQVNEKDHR